MLGLTTAARYLARGPLCDRLERIFVSGLGLSLSERLWPGFPPCQLAGMPELDWLWCQEHEPYLWEELRRFLEHPHPKQARFHWLLPDWSPPPSNPVPAGAALYLGRELTAASLRERQGRELFPGLLQSPQADILRTFRRKVGLDNSRARSAPE